MKKHLLALVFALFGHAAHAQTPVTVFVEWDAPTSAQHVQTYMLYLDATPSVLVPVTVDTVCTCIKTPVSVTPGPHVVKVTAMYQLLADDPASITEGSPAIVSFSISNGDVKNIKVRTK